MKLRSAGMADENRERRERDENSRGSHAFSVISANGRACYAAHVVKLKSDIVPVDVGTVADLNSTARRAKVRAAKAAGSTQFQLVLPSSLRFEATAL